MAGGDAELVERITRAWNERDTETLRALTAPDAEYVNAPDALEPGTRRGMEALVNVAEKQWEALGHDARQEIEGIHVRGDEVLSEIRLSRSMPGSDTEVETRALLSWSFRDGRLTRLAVLGAGTGFREARAAAGIEG